MATYVRRIGERFAGTRAIELLLFVGTTVRGVTSGIIGTALAQGILTGIGFWIAGLSHAPVLGFLTFALAFVPIGPPLVWGAVALWLRLQGSVWWSIFVAVWV
jgi:predicted PurR-regulated permease PerM